MHVSGWQLSKHKNDPMENKSQECLINNSNVSLFGAELAEGHMAHTYKSSFVEIVCNNDTVNVENPVVDYYCNNPGETKMIPQVRSTKNVYRNKFLR